MKTSIAYTGKLSQRQLVRLGGLIAFVCGRRPYDTILNDLTENGFVAEYDNNLELTDLGRRDLHLPLVLWNLILHQYKNLKS